MKKKQIKHSVKRVISAVVTFCLIVLIILSLVVVVKTTLADDPSVLGFRFFYIISGSMEPTIPVSAAVVTKRQFDYAVGDVITFRSTDSAIMDCPNTHRIVAVMNTDDGIVYQTKGDANNVPDAQLVPFDDVYGKVVLITPALNRVGEFLEFLLTPSGFFILLVIPMLLVTVFAMKEFAKNCHAALLQQAQASFDAQQKEQQPANTDQNVVPAQPAEEEPVPDSSEENEKEKGSGDTP